MFRYRHPEIHQEEDEIPLLRVLLGFLFVLAVSAVLLLWAWDMMAAREAALRPSGVFPDKYLTLRHEVGMVQEDVFDDLYPGERLEARQRAALDRFGVADQDKGTVTIPIDTAVELLVGGRGR